MKRQVWAVFVAALALMAVAAGVLARLQSGQRLGEPGLKVVAEPAYDTEGRVIGTNSVWLPPQVLDYHSTSAPVTLEELGWLPKDTTYGRRQYTAPDGQRIALGVVLMGTDRTSIHKPEYCLPGQGFSITQTERDFVSVAKPRPYQLPVTKMTATKFLKDAAGGQTAVRAIFVFWFVADKHLTADHTQWMWWMVKELVLTGKLQRWAYVSCLGVCAPGNEAATYERMKQLIAAAVPEFQLTTGGAATTVSQR